MKVRIFIRKEAALKAGVDQYGYKVVDVPASSLTEQQRETLSKYWHSGTAPNEADFFLDHSTPHNTTEATAESVRKILDGINEAEAKKEAEDKGKLEAHVAEWLKKPIEEFVCSDRYANIVLKDRTSEPWRTWNIPADSRLDSRCAEAEQLAAKMNEENKRKRDEEKAKNDAIEAKKKAEKERGENILAEWVAANGSEFVKARKEDGFEWIGLAEREYADNVVELLGLDVEEQYEYDSDKWEVDDTSDRTTPTMEEINFLRSVKKHVGNLPVDLSLNWVKYKPINYGDHDGDPDLFSQTELEVSVTTPTGREILYWFIPSNVVVK